MLYQQQIFIEYWKNRDTLPSKWIRDTLPSYIMNLDSANGPGTHWTAFYYNYPWHSIYFDPFGFPPPEEDERTIKPYTYSNDIDIQDLDSTACGWYRKGFITILKGKQNIYTAFDSFINLFDGDTKQNDAILYRLLHQQFHRFTRLLSVY